VLRHYTKRNKTIDLKTCRYICSQPENCISSYEPHAYCVVYSTVDRASLRCAEETLQCLWKSDTVSSKAVILVANKTDLVRSRTVTTEGKVQNKSMRDFWWTKWQWGRVFLSQAHLFHPVSITPPVFLYSHCAHCVTNRKFTGSITDGVIANFH
jgi:hypothetical protein